MNRKMIVRLYQIVGFNPRDEIISWVVLQHIPNINRHCD